MRFDLNESRDGSSRRGKGRSFHVERPKTEKAREPTVEIESVTGERNLEAESFISQAERRVRKGG